MFFLPLGLGICAKKYAREMVLTVMTSRIAAYHFAALNVFNASMPTMYRLTIRTAKKCNLSATEIFVAHNKHNQLP